MNQELAPSLLLSSNFYQSLCDKTRPKTVEEFHKLVEKRSDSKRPLNIFLDGRSAKSIFDQNEFNCSDGKVTIYVHRTDVIPSYQQMKRMSGFNFTIKSVNWLGDSSICKPIPIGIPPETYNSELGRFIISNLQSPQSENKKDYTFKYYVNFDITTYLGENEFEAVGEDQSIVAESE